MSPRECLSKANDCERMARDSRDDIDRRMLLATSEHWRNLAHTAKTPARRNDDDD